MTASATEDRAALAAELTKALDAVTVAQPAAVKVLTVVDDPNTTARQVAAAIELDPTFAAQIMRLANSAYYGMSGRIGNTGFAVTVIGFAAVRSMAAISATGLTSGKAAVPDGFWRHAAAAAAGASVVAPTFGLVAADCFAAGLLHDIGSAFLFGFDRAAHVELTNRFGADSAELAEAEDERFGMGHDAAAAHVLASWRFPEPFVNAVAWHHRPSSSDHPLAAAVRIGDLLAQMAETGVDEAVVATLVDEGIAAEEIEGLVQVTADRAGEILASLSV